MGRASDIISMILEVKAGPLSSGMVCPSKTEEMCIQGAPEVLTTSAIALEVGDVPIQPLKESTKVRR